MMSIANAFSNAMSGLAAVGRRTEAVSSNLANATTAGYGRREVDLSSRVTGGGVNVNGIIRIMSSAAVAESRLANAEFANASRQAAFFNQLEKTIGEPLSAGSLGAALTKFDADLIAAAGRPESDLHLSAVINSADRVVGKIRAISDGIQAQRSDADRQIAQNVDQLRTGLQDVAALNRQITSQKANRQDVSSLLDARQQIIDRMADIVPLKEVARDGGRVALFTQNGALLLDGNIPADIAFSPTHPITADLDVAGAGLGQIMFNDRPVSNGPGGLFDGGALSALFDIRDQLAPAAQVDIDAFARDFHDRFAAHDLDPTLAADESGLFTDGVTAFDPSKERGLASRISINPFLDPKQGGELWRVRSGVNATSPNPVGNGTVILAMRDALDKTMPHSSPALSGKSQSLVGFSADIFAGIANKRIAAESETAHHKIVQDSLQAAIFSDGVDSDHEMEKLLQLEAAYAANARVIKALDEMMNQILRL